MRRHVTLLTLVLAALVALLACAGPALAGPAHCPPNEVALIKALKHRGAIPRDASKAQAQSILQKYLKQKLGSQPEDQRDLAGASSRYSPWRSVLRATTGTFVDNTLVILVEFSNDDLANPAEPDWPFEGGPLHGQIPAPGPGDNSTFWPGPGTKGFGVKHYQSMLFGTSFPVYRANGTLRGVSKDTMHNFFLTESKGKYTVSGSIAAWVKLDKPESYYGRDSVSNIDDYTGPIWRVVTDAIDALHKAQPNFPWAKYDKKNPYGIAGSDPNVPDGIIDHLIIVHAGVDQSAGGGAQGDDSIWAHSSDIDPWNGLGPGGKGGYMIPGTEGQGPGGNGIWARHYTCNPEDGAAGVFCHEFSHDLGLPDEYDVTYGGEAPSAFWTLMSQGSWLGKKFGIGSVAGPLNAWDRTFLGWLKPQKVAVGATKTFHLPASATGAYNKVAFRINLPDAHHQVDLGDPGGSTAPELWSGMGDELDSLLTTTSAVTVPDDTNVALSFDTWYEIEDGYDYAYVEVSTDGGSTWTALTNGDTVDSPTGAQGLTGGSNPDGDGNPQWTTESYDLSAYAGQDVLLRFHYKTDEAYSLRGWEIDNITVAGDSETGFTNDGHISDFDAPQGSGWNVGWKQIDGYWEGFTHRYYYGEYHNRAGVDASLAACYNFTDTPYVHVEFYPYDTGLHLIYNDTFFLDDNVAMHPGEGAQMVVDSHPYPDMRVAWDDDWNPIPYPWPTGIQVRDAAFGTKATLAVWLTPFRGTPEKVLLASRKAQPVFDDTWQNRYWFPSAWDAGTLIDPLGVRITVRGLDKHGALIVTVKGADLPLG